ncbi:hypothetical protein G7L40_20015 [Paenibacillus polymyxa]|uniref:Uncharacterized protein n=1 Tax=Paenibacillus polymyxa TaxID=1406 RepID=A0A378XZ83_PAEPO|nr:hypothetical protein [Paenibacillus polymyxa]MBE7896225.1 hypothetical protein [Paenibacillus polymyxa]MBG9765844.1 hypothetical protein [Paenibacillus polymyxa]MCC3256754.1 hypothetical protein [Paenibacillus polymyxa]QPK54759.1 hypothetical protein G7035_20055 [Paenibacillus polymyxa]QPK59850.1 hypothetical protein G7L40_20015 [Paenibacillus polymyxa]
MKIVSEFITRDCEYNSKEERKNHRKIMFQDGWEHKYDYEVIKSNVGSIPAASYEKDVKFFE